jgi:hypothetical protein
MHLFKRKRRINGRISQSKTWYGEYRIEGMLSPQRVNLDCTDKQVANTKLQEIVIETERESKKLISPKSIRETLKTPLSKLLKEYLQQLASRQRTKRHVKNNRKRITHLMEDCGWKFIQDVIPEAFESWRTKQNLAPKTLNDYLGLTRSFLTG